MTWSERAGWGFSRGAPGPNHRCSAVIGRASVALSLTPRLANPNRHMGELALDRLAIELYNGYCQGTQSGTLTALSHFPFHYSADSYIGAHRHAVTSLRYLWHLAFCARHRCLDCRSVVSPMLAEGHTLFAASDPSGTRWRTASHVLGGKQPYEWLTADHYYRSDPGGWSVVS